LSDIVGRDVGDSLLFANAVVLITRPDALEPATPAAIRVGQAAPLLEMRSGVPVVGLVNDAPVSRRRTSR
jgi:hypothetical protein